MESLESGPFCWECHKQWADHREVYYKGQMVLECPPEKFDFILWGVVILMALFVLYLAGQIIRVTISTFI